MSIRLMSQVWDLILPDSEKLVLLALADAANDEGVCWPSIATIARKCTRSERTVQSVIKKLVEDGHLSRDERPGRGVFYTIHPRSDCTPASAAPPQPDTPPPATVAPHPRNGCGGPPQRLHPNRKEPSLNHQRSVESAGDGAAVDLAWKVQSLLDTVRPPTDEDVALVNSWLAAGLEPDEILDAIRERKGTRKVERIRYFEKPMRELADAAREKAKEAVAARDPKNQRAALRLYQQAPLTWCHASYGSLPGQPGCLIDPAILREFGYAVWEWSDGSWREAA